MAHLEKKDLFSLEKYAEIRDEFRKQEIGRASCRERV